MNKQEIDAQFAIIKNAIKRNKPDAALDAIFALSRDALICLNIIAGRSGNDSPTKMEGPKT